jgi:S1-C subfamily serine protease
MRYLAMLVLPLLAIGCARPNQFDALHAEDATVTVQVPGRPVGRGFFVSPDGSIVTCMHLLKDGKINVRLPDGHEAFATIVNADRENDLAIIKLPTPEKGKEFKILHLNDEDITPGMHVRVAGRGGVTEGTFDQWEDFGHTIDFTAPITSGDAGSPLLADDNRVIGIVLGPFEQHAKAAKAYLALQLVPRLKAPPEFGKE